MTGEGEGFGDCSETDKSNAVVNEDVILKNRRGLHARASAKFCALATSFDAQIIVSKDGYKAGGCSIMGLLTLAAGIGSSINIAATGKQAIEAVNALLILVDDRFGEDE